MAGHAAARFRIQRTRRARGGFHIVDMRFTHSHPVHAGGTAVFPVGVALGTEIDGVVTYKASWKQTFGLKFAYYDADTFATDTTKVWLFTGFKF